MANRPALIATLCCLTDAWVPQGFVTYDPDADRDDAPIDATLARLDDVLCHWGDKSALVLLDGTYVTSFFDLTQPERDALIAFACQSAGV